LVLRPFFLAAIAASPLPESGRQCYANREMLLASFEREIAFGGLAAACM
jgi:hypothetical protein